MTSQEITCTKVGTVHNLAQQTAQPQIIYSATYKCSSGLLVYASSNLSAYYCNLINHGHAFVTFVFSTPCEWPRVQALYRDVRACWVLLDHDKVLSKSLPETLARVGRL